MGKAGVAGWFGGQERCTEGDLQDSGDGLSLLSSPPFGLTVGVMNQEITNQTDLSIYQQKRLVNIISDQFGPYLVYEEFTDQVLLLFEDISGFEMISDSVSQTIVNQLWSYYHGTDN